jgi:hypothetical protein
MINNEALPDNKADLRGCAVRQVRLLAQILAGSGRAGPAGCRGLCMTSNRCAPRNLEQYSWKLHVRAELLELIAQRRTSVGSLCLALGIRGGHINVVRFLKYGYTWVISAQRVQKMADCARRSPSAGEGRTPAPLPGVEKDARLTIRNRLRLLIKIKRLNVCEACARLGISSDRTCGFLANSREFKLANLSIAEAEKLLAFAEKCKTKPGPVCRLPELRQWQEGIRHDLAAVEIMAKRDMYDSLCDVSIAAVEKAFKLYLAVAGGDLDEYFTILKPTALYDLCRSVDVKFDSNEAISEIVAQLVVFEETGRAASKNEAENIRNACYCLTERLLECTPGYARLINVYHARIGNDN